MASVGIRELRDHLSRYLKRVKAGEQVTVKERGRAIAQLVPMEPGAEHDALKALLQEGVARWAGGKPQGAAHPPHVRGRPVAEFKVQGSRFKVQRAMNCNGWKRGNGSSSMECPEAQSRGRWLDLAVGQDRTGWSMKQPVIAGDQSHPMDDGRGDEKAVARILVGQVDQPTLYRDFVIE